MSELKEFVHLIEYYVSASTEINGVKAFHFTRKTALKNEFFYEALDILKSKGYEVRDRNFVSESRLARGKEVGFEISYRIEGKLNKNSRELFLFLLKNIITQKELGKPCELDRPNSQLDNDFRSVLHRLYSVGVKITQKDSDFSDNYTHYTFTWEDL